MSDTTGHLRTLVDAARKSARALSAEAGIGELLVYLDLIERARSYSEATQREAGVAEQLAQAAAGVPLLRERAVELLGSGDIFEQISQRADAFLDEEDVTDSVAAWGADVLMLASASVWLPPALRAEAQAVLTRAINWAELYPEELADVADLARWRMALEPTDQAAPVVQQVLALFSDLPARARALESGPAPSKEHILAQIARARPRSSNVIELFPQGRAARLSLAASELPSSPLPDAWSTRQITPNLVLKHCKHPLEDGTSLLFLQLVSHPQRGPLLDGARLLGLSAEQVRVLSASEREWRVVVSGEGELRLEIPSLSLTLPLHIRWSET